MELSLLNICICILWSIGLKFIPSIIICDAQSPNIRLIGGTSAMEGRVEVFYNGYWGTVCDDNFDDKDAAVVCHMLGFSRINAKAKGSAFFGEGSGQIWMDELRCTDSDTDLFQCPQNSRGTHNCVHGEDAGVVCQTLSGTDIRLVSGSSSLEGRVEIFYKGEWGTVCDDSWDNNDAAVVCFMLGFSRKTATAKTSAYFGQGNSQMRIWTDDVKCQGDERDLFHCNKSRMGEHNCGHSEDAGVVCSLDEAVRLVGGNTSLEGRVEIHHEGSWGTICDDGWDNEDAAVICSMLGFSRNNSIAKGGGSFPNGVGPILLDDVGCTGSERFISQCRHRGWNRHNCQHSEDAGVSCRLKESSVNGCGTADILIVMDDSGSVGSDNFIKMKTFVKDVIRGLNSVLFRFGVITFSGTVTKKFGFADYVHLPDILSAVDTIAFRSGGSTQTGDALRYVRQSIFNVRRPDAANIVILCTDGKSTNSDETKQQAAQLRSQEVRIFAIGVGSGPDTEELKAIASSPSNEHVFQVSSFTALPQIQNAVQNRTCEASVDGGFSEWSTWTQCSRTCGSGTKTRSRTCTNPVPTNNGRNCTGRYWENVPCTIAGCPVDGQWGDWTAWRDCSVSCGSGYQQRIRNCTNPSPQNGGLQCRGTNAETQTCNSSPCPIHGGFSSWNNWSSCSKSCGLGSKSRGRSCSNPTPQYNGRNCTGDFHETEDCLITLCPVDGGWSLWSTWTQCDVSCGGGMRVRRRTCDTPFPRYGGQSCSGENHEEKDCNTMSCPVDGGFSQWSDWSSCSQTCGLGQRTRNRSCTNPSPMYNGRNCSGINNEREECLIKKCPVHGNWAIWSTWTHCNVSCGGGRRERNRLCKNPQPRHGGRPCFGEEKESMDCNTNPCPINGGFGEWSSWGLCSQSCNSGYRTRYRNCINPTPLFGGSNCSGTWEETQTCNDHNCPVHGGFGDWTQWSACSRTCGSGKRQRYRDCNNPLPAFGGRRCSGDFVGEEDCIVKNCSINGGFSDWGTWSTCSKTCGGGLIFRQRSCNDPPPAFDGLNCTGSFVESALCQSNPCPIHGQFGSWEEWSPCSRSCDGGTQSRVRKCNNPYPRYGGQNCTGGFSESRSCNLYKCPIDGSFGDWARWTDCTVSCGGGKKSRTRFCDSPSPLFGGRNCNGSFSEETVCKTFPCPIDGYFDEWEAWTACSRTCGGGIQTRNRVCFDPKHGGRACTGHFVESLNCNTQNCPINGKFSEWETWTHCTQTCGRGIKKRSRYCNKPIPMYGGKNCSGDFTEESVCNINPCPIDGNFAEWNEWTDCSQTCGSGKQYRRRTCSNPYPQYGGNDCIGKSMESMNCNTFSCPINGRFSSWSDWSSCTASCGGGTSKRVRTCNNPPPRYGGNNCSGEFEELVMCMNSSCPINGGFGEWSVWSSCSKSCGTGEQTRQRFCDNPKPQFGGENCKDIFENKKDCNTQPCPIDGLFGDWQSWNTCPVSCGGGIRNRTRLCDSPSPSFGGRNCIGHNVEESKCNENHCPVDGGFAEWNEWSQCTRSCGSGVKIRNRTCDNPLPQHGGRPCIGHFIDYTNCNFQLCPIDGGLSEWGSWSSCSVSCAGGISKRLRFCTNPIPRYGGKNCSDNLTETRICQTNSCPIDGGFSEWSMWSTCSKSCGLGSKRRERQCDMPVPKHGGKNCSGLFSENESCKIGPCPIHGGFSNWGMWGDCSTTCGGGRKTRERKCNNPVPAFGGNNCTESFSEDIECNTFFCPIDGQFSEWSEWSICSASCNGGSKNRTRTCSSPPPRYGGKPCNGLSTEYGVCNTHQCPIDGKFTEWGSWTPCSVTCGGGLSNRTRFCANPRPQYGGKNCSGLFSESQMCMENPCPINGGFSEWNLWSECSTSCGGGLKIRKRTCSNPSPQYGGLNCTGQNKDTENCNTLPCPVDGGFGNWEFWSVCTSSCGGGTKRRERQCNSPIPAHGGKNCDGNYSQLLECNEFPCPINGGFTEWTAWSQCSRSCGGGVKTRLRTCTNPSPQNGGKPCNGHFIESLNCNVYHCPVDGGFSLWGAWSSCSVTCGGGKSKRSRSCSDPSPLYGGKNCTGDMEEFTNCNTQNCPIDGRYNDWSSWSECSLTCGGGLKARSRRCNNPSPQYGGKQCSGSDNESSSCNQQPCPINGKFSEWSTWSTCSRTCGGGTKTKSRECNNPIPAFGGENCTGPFHKSTDCNTLPCQIDGGLSMWSEWTICSVSCGGGVQLRNRSCTNPVPQYGGLECDGEMTQSLLCNTHECPVDGKFSEWGSWSTCTVSCGGGNTTRIRSCNNPVPQYGGKNCIGESEQIKTCNSVECPIDGGFSEWGVWSECSVTCGGGTTIRRRFCSNPTPQYGGKLCLGSSNETRVCNTESCSICENPNTEFECHNKAHCVDKTFVCDGYPDCDDESDESEQACNLGKTKGGLPPCPEGLYRCPNSMCKPSQLDC
ncbi:SCO-spondin-like isoform X2 [Saccostrea echinata]|uniref:SCO-spondin-like isoform X2 n=1 Tax=Saccostrea echinata TaxID=191078 RepID=UPI002A825799|nr:SCO-spondin-like isoform X2 [Saccostrea echinata]